MPLIARREKPIAEASDRELRKRAAAAQRMILELPDAPGSREVSRHLATLHAAAKQRDAALGELDRRERAKLDAANAEFRRRVQASQRPIAAKALEAVTAFGHPELAGTTLDPARLDNAQAAELLALARRRRGDDDTQAGLDPVDEARYLGLVELAAGEDNLFARRRAEKAEAEKREMLEKAARRLPQAESLIAALMAEHDLFDGLRHRLRTDADVIDEYGRTVPGAVAARIYEPENIVALFVLVNAITANGGEAVGISEHGIVERGLPPIPRGSLAALRRNEWLTVTEDGAGVRVGLGERTKDIAAKWSIDPEPS